MRRQVAIAAMGAMLLAGCGSAGLSPVAPQTPGSSAPSQVIGLPTPSLGGRDPHAQRLLRAMGQAQQALNTATYEGVMYCRGSVGGKPKPLADLGGEWEATTHYEVAYRRSERYHIAVTRCSNPNSVGMKMLVEGERAKVKLPGLLGLLTINKALGDKEMLNFRGHRLDHGSLGGLAARFGHGDPDARYAGTMVQDGELLNVVEIPRAPDFDRAIVKEVLALDARTHLLRYHAMFTAERKVYDMRIRQLKVNAPVGESRMAL